MRPTTLGNELGPPSVLASDEAAASVAVVGNWDPVAGQRTRRSWESTWPTRDRFAIAVAAAAGAGSDQSAVAVDGVAADGTKKGPFGAGGVAGGVAGCGGCGCGAAGRWVGNSG